MNTFSHVPPGFRFHPTDEELVDHYLRKKIASKKIDLDIIKDVDLYKIEPWDLQELCKIGSDEETEWYFFSHKDKKYPTSSRTNRATKAGFWKATGRDKSIYTNNICLIGMRKTLVFYKGRAPNGQKSDWIMHEYRLESNENGTTIPQEEGWVVCKVFKKRIATTTRYDHDVSSFMQHESPNPYASYQLQNYPCKQEMEMQYNMLHNDVSTNFLQLPELESPKLECSNSSSHSSMINTQLEQQYLAYGGGNSSNDLQAVVEQSRDWGVLDKSVACQSSNHHDASYAVDEHTDLLPNNQSKKSEEFQLQFPEY